ncbi:casein kinase II subunit alpha, chloroplastic-like [Gossypium australe]|uniref:Casein kinase II subunit alpha, chloroplastic-like n=1 Tax=Gossypium australe TaxID=47621 RepID=A0A5B6VBU4_9ROSI|nr:casein kinase II subunit alpha, chloroplastic-like [Gossypium australe]
MDHAFSWLDLQTLGSITTWNIFYNGLDANSRSSLDGAAGGVLMNRTYEDAYELIENMVMNSCKWPNVQFAYG